MMQNQMAMNEKDYRLLTKPQYVPLSLSALPSQHAAIESLVKERERANMDMVEQQQQSSVPSDVKYDEFQQALRRYLLMHDKMQKPIPIPIVKVPPKVNATATTSKLPLNLQGLTQRQRELTDVLVDHLVQHNPDVNWNARNELIVDDQIIPNSNMIDLIHDLVRTRRNAPPPLGFVQLAPALVRHNAPREAIANLARRQAIFNPPQVDDDDNFEDTYADFGQQQGFGLVNFRTLY